MGCRGLWEAVPGQTLFQVMCAPPPIDLCNRGLRAVSRFGHLY